MLLVVLLLVWVACSALLLLLLLPVLCPYQGRLHPSNRRHQLLQQLPQQLLAHFHALRCGCQCCQQAGAQRLYGIDLSRRFLSGCTSHSAACSCCWQWQWWWRC
jgi:hypothetical protein